MNQLKQLSVTILKQISDEDSGITQSLKNKLSNDIIAYLINNENNTQAIQSLITQSITIKINDTNNLTHWIAFLQNFFLYKLKEHQENEFNKDNINNKLSDIISNKYKYIKVSLESLIQIYNFFEQPDSFSGIFEYYFSSLFKNANYADALLEEQAEKPWCLDDCGKVLLQFFGKFQSSEDLITTFYSCLALIKVYFKLKTYRNAKTLIGWVERRSLNVEADVKSSFASEYYYYCGRLSLYEMNLDQSKANFEKAFKLIKKINNSYHNSNNTNNTLSTHFKNKKLILEYIIVINLFYGLVPSKQFLIKYSLNQNYSNFISSYIAGDLKSFEKEILSLEDRLITLGTFLLVEKLKGFVLRNLVFRIYESLREEILSANYPILSLNLIYSVVSMLSDFEDFEEFEYYMISVLYKGLIKGYIHNEKKEIVFSKKEPFPRLNDVLANNYNKII